MGERGWTEKGLIPGVNQRDGIEGHLPLIDNYLEISAGKAIGYITDLEGYPGLVRVNNRIEVWPGSLAVRALMEVGVAATIGYKQTDLYIPRFVRVENWGLPGQMFPNITYYLEADILEQEGNRVTMTGSIWTIDSEIISSKNSEQKYRKIIFDLVSSIES